MAEAVRTESRVPPHNYEAEQSILGSMLLNARCVDEALVHLQMDDFYHPQHREIFSAMEYLMENGTAVDLVTVSERLEKEGKMRIGGMEYLSRLTETVPSISNIGHYIHIVSEKASLRRLIDTCMLISDECYAAKEDADVLIGRAGDEIYRIAVKDRRDDVMHIRDAVTESYVRIGEILNSQDGMMGIPTGFPLMDKMLSGFQGTQLIVVAGRPGMGKTSFALNVVEHVSVTRKIPSLIFSLEMGAEQLATRLLCSDARLDSQRIRSGNLGDNDIEQLADSMKRLSKVPIYIDDSASINVTEMLAKAHRLKRTKGLGMIVIDYLQLMQGTGRMENRQQEVSQMTRSLKVMAKELDIPIVLLSQLSRASEKRDKSRYPMLSDLRESGAIEQDADVVLFLHREDYYQQQDADDEQHGEGISRIIIAKQRNGPTGSIQVKWHGELTKFEELDFIHDDEEPEY